MHYQRRVPNYQEIIKNFAYLYYNQGVQIQYDQTSGRRMLNVLPEMATNENYLYFDCSSYVNSIYFFLFGIDIFPGATSTTTNTKNFMLFAKNNFGSSSMVIDYTVTSDYHSSIEKANKLNNLYSQLEIGDIIVYRYDNSSRGHAMIYVENNTFLHVTGASYDYNLGIEKPENNGAVLVLEASEVFVNTNSSRYLFNNNINEFCLLRPLNNDNLTLTAYGKSRHYLPYLDLEKYANISNYSAVANGNTITYSISVKNNSQLPLYNIYIYDELSINEMLFSIEPLGNFVDSKLTFYLDKLEGNQTKVLHYTVLIDKKFSVQLVSENTNIRNIYFNPLYFTIIDSNDEELDNLIETINNTINYTYTNELNALANIYGETHPITMLSSLFDIYNSEFVAFNLWGGKTIDSSSLNNLDMRVRLLRSDYLIPGDLIIIKNGSDFTLYIYAKDKTYKYNKSSNKLEIFNLDCSKLLINDEYKVIRPLQMS